MIYTVSFRDVTPSRATVTAVDEGNVAASSSLYALVDEALLPVVGERVWIRSNGMTWGQITITGRGPSVEPNTVRGIPVERLDTYLGPKQLDALYDQYGAERVNLAIRDRRKQLGLEQP